MVNTILLDRQFAEWSETESSDPELRFRFSTYGVKTWDDLLRKPRVVILAEAGSGKSEELNAQAARKAEAGEFSFYATVQDVGRKGVSGALRAVERAQLEAWRNSNRSGWFFIDSVDEAKLDGVRLDEAFRELGNAIHGAEARAHIVLSGRLTDWEFQRDLQRFSDDLPIVAAKNHHLPELSPDELVVKTIRFELPKQEDEPGRPERPLVVAMLPLDPSRVELFAAARGIQGSDLEQFISQINAANLWHFARRPLDLDWMVQFWRTQRRLGSLSEMLENSLAERLREPNLDRTRRDRLDAVRALQGMERIGAALVFGRTKTIAIPDSTLSLHETSPPLDLADVLSDWSAEDRALLLTRPVFDPATFGRARLHNDNQGVVSAFLAARWLLRLRASNLSQADLFDLLFADSYGIQLIKPSMQETAAWLAISDPTVARKIVDLNPFLLLTAGDPAKLSIDTRRDVLRQCVELIVRGMHAPILDSDAVMRFAHPDLARIIREFWIKHHDSVDVRKLLLRLIWLGRLTTCADIATEAAFSDRPNDSSLHLYAARALCSATDDDTKRRYVSHLISRLGQHRNAVIWHAADELFPTLLTVENLLAILAGIDVSVSDGLGFDYLGPKLIARIRSQDKLETLLAGMLSLVGNVPTTIGYRARPREIAYFPAVGAAATCLLALSPVNEAPAIAIEAVLQLGEYRHERHAEKAALDPQAELDRSSTRRRRAFWRAAERFGGHPTLQGRQLEHAWQMTIFGFRPKLAAEDIDWLLEDGPTRNSLHEQRLAIHAALEMWTAAGSPSALLQRIRASASQHPAMDEAFRLSMTPISPSPELLQQRREIEILAKRNKRERAKFDKSWTDFTASIRANPNQLRELSPVSAEGVDRRLLNLWRLLEQGTSQRSRFALDSVAPLEPMVGAEAALAVRDGLIGLWRHWKPRVKSTRTAADRNTINSIDCMGIAGITLEAKDSPDWSRALTPDEARRATEYATLELNGFPPWISSLATTHPSELREILLRESIAEMDRQEPGIYPDILSDIDRADTVLSTVMGNAFLSQLRDRVKLQVEYLAPLLHIITRGIEGPEREEFASLCRDRFNTAADPRVACLYLQSLFAIQPDGATDALLQRLGGLKDDEQTTLAVNVLPAIFGDRFGRGARAPKNLPVRILEQLVITAFRTVRIENDNYRPSGEAFTPDARDQAEGARSNVFALLVETPGRATFDALNRLSLINDFSVSPARLRELAFERAANDSETAPWKPGDLLAFEKTYETAPSTGKDLRHVVMRRFADMQHDLLHDDFAQGQSVKALPVEAAVQNWIADRLRLKQGRSFSVEREPHVVGEKEPDIRVRAKVTDASVPIEIKVAESWTLEQLEAALTSQLCGQYLRSNDSRHGVLLLVHQMARPSGWRSEAGSFLTFGEVAVYLQAMAERLCGESTDGPQPAVSVLDVSSCPSYEAQKAKRAKRSAARPGGLNGSDEQNERAPSPARKPPTASPPRSRGNR